MTAMLSAREFIEENWAQIVSDIETLVVIPSVADTDEACPGAPFGLQARAALDSVVAIAARMGFEARVEKGYVAICDVAGADDGQLGVIGHLDVVPAGPGWNVDPFALTEREGWLLGRGILDDKGPIMLAFWALKYWTEYYSVASGGLLPHPVRFIFGSDEENGMSDVEYYRSHYDDPVFLFTPDAEFPVCHGEKGMFGVVITSKPLNGRRSLLDVAAGSVFNAVPGQAHAVYVEDGLEKRVEFHGTSAHASKPEKGESALKMLVECLLESSSLSHDERGFLEVASLVSNDFYGESLGLSACDRFFGKLTGVAGTMRIEDNRFVLTYDVRFPTSTNGENLENQLHEALAPWGDSIDIDVIRNVEPFLVEAESGPVKALVSAYNEVTGENAVPFTMGGATYAREFSCACSFGMEMPWVELPSWVGSMHGPNEGVSIEQMKLALEIYIAAFGKLFGIGLK